MEDFIIEDNRIYLEKEGKLLAEITYNKKDENTYVIDHTFVDESLRGQGIASKLVEKAVEEIKKKNGTIKATCSYAKSWLEKHEI